MRKAIHFTTVLMAVIAALCVVAIAISITVDVALRETRGHGIPGIVEYSEILLTALAYLALANSERTNNHIKLVLVTGLTPDRIAQGMRVVGAVVTLLLVAVIAYFCFFRFLYSIETSEFRYGLLWVPTWPARLAIFIGFFMLAVECTLTLIDYVKDLLAGRNSEPEAPIHI